jgi:hypothetical protein
MTRFVEKVVRPQVRMLRDGETSSQVDGGANRGGRRSNGSNGREDALMGKTLGGWQHARHARV